MAAPSFSATTTADEVATTFAPRVKGLNVLVTGVSPGGLGAEVARIFAKHGAGLVIATARDATKLASVLTSIRQETPSANIRPVILDLSSQASVRKAATEVMSWPEPIHLLINNAAVMASDYVTTADGFENQFATNHLGHFTFTNLILPKLRAAASETSSSGVKPRIVNVSSSGHVASGIRFTDPGFSSGSAYSKWVAYGQSKTANILFSKALCLRLKTDGILSFSLHPGQIWTNLGRHLSKEEMVASGFMNEDGTYKPDMFKSVGQGAATTMVAALDSSIESEPGSYLVDCNLANDRVAAHARSDEDAHKLWKLSEDLVGQKF